MKFQWLEFSRNRFPFTQGLMKIFRFFTVALPPSPVLPANPHYLMSEPVLSFAPENSFLCGYGESGNGFIGNTHPEWRNFNYKEYGGWFCGITIPYRLCRAG